MKNILIVGDSHIIALVEAARTLAAEQGGTSSYGKSADGMLELWDIRLPQAHLQCIRPQPDCPPLLQSDAAGYRVAAPFASQFAAAAAAFDGPLDLMVSCVFGNEHSTFALVEHPVPFDFFADADDPGMPPSRVPRQVLPRQVVERHLTGLSTRIVIYNQVFRRVLPAAEQVHVLSPPPIPDEAHLRGNPEIFGDLFDTYGLAPAALRRRIHALYCALLTEQLVPLHVRTIAAPPAGLDDQGNLAAPYWREATHANGAYGRMQLAQLGIQ